MANEDDLFAEAMSKVKPLPASDKRQPETSVSKKRVKPLPIRRQQQALPWTGPTSVSPQQSDEPWVLIANGISREKLKRFAAGSPSIEKTFDLHGLNRDEAMSLLDQGCQQLIAQQVRGFCIVHGRGLHSQGKAVLKEAVYRWLKEGPLAHWVLAAVPQPGSGGGACLVLLRRK